MNADRAESMNADPAELAHFERMASRWWDADGESRPLHDLNPVRHAYVAARVALRGAKVVDVGCGGGLLSEALAASGAVVTGIDLAPALLDVARLHLHESGLMVDYRETSVEALAAEQAGAFAAVTCMEMLEHVPDPESTVRACATLVRPGGWVFFSTINRNPKAFMLAIVGAEYLLRMLPRGTHEYEKFIRPSELAAAARRSGLEAVEVIGMTYNPITRRYRLDRRDVDVNYLAAFRRPA